MGRRGSAQGDLYARGWEQGVRDARKMLLRCNGDTALAIEALEHLVVRARAIRAQAESGEHLPTSDRVLP